MRSSSRGTALAVVATAVEKVGALGIALWLPRQLALAEYGHYTFVVALLALFQSLPDTSLESVLVARMARDTALAPRLAGRGALVRAATSLAGGILGLAAIVASSGDPGLLAPATCWGAGLVLAAANPYRALLRAQLRLGRYLAVAIGQTAVVVVVLVLVVRTGGGLVGVTSTAPAGAVAAIVLGRLLAGRDVRLAVDAALARVLLAAAWPLTGATVVLLAAQQTLQVLLLRTHGAAAVGLLGGAQRLVDALNLLPQAVVVSLLPALARGGVASAGRTAREAARVLAVVVAPVVTALVVWPEPVLRTVLGPSFAAAADVLRVLVALSFLAATGSVVSAYLVAAGRERLLLVVTGVASVLVLGVGGMLVPRLGPLGAAIAAVAGMACGQLTLALVDVSAPTVRGVLAAAARPLAIAALVGGAAAAFAPAGVSAAVTCAALYVVAVLATGTVTRADVVRWLR